MSFHSEEFDLPAVPKRHDWPGIVGALVVVALMGLGGLFMGGTFSTHSSAPVTQAAPAPAAETVPAENERGFAIDGKWHTVEYWLSCIDDSTSEVDYGYLLDALQVKFPEVTRHHISDYLVQGQKLLRQKGIRESLSEFGWHVDESVPRELAGKMKFPEVAALYITLTTSGR